MPSKRIKSIFTDCLIGAVSAVICFIAAFYIEVSYLYLFVSAASLITGFVRGKQKLYEKLVQIILLNFLYFPFLLSVTVFALEYAIIPFISVAGTAIGIYLRTRKFPSLKPVMLLFVYLLSIVLLSFSALPAFLRWMHWSAPLTKYSRFKLLDIKNDTIYSESLSNKVIVMDFWATWCKPCVKSLPVMEEVYNKYRNNSKVKFLIINTGKRDLKQKSLLFIKEHNYDLPFVFDINQQTSKSYGVTGIPIIIIIDKKKIPRIVHSGYEGSAQFKKDLIAHINSLINEE